MAKALLIGLILIASQPIFADNVVNYQLTPQPSTYQFPFFKTPTPVWSYNGEIPGPLIKAKVGSIINVEVKNRLDEPTTVHWHGLRIDNAMDGVPGVTQDPIKSGESFTYRLDLKDAGVFWYHPHLNSGEQLGRGLKGIIIVEEKQPLPWSQDIVWFLDDWLLQADGTIFPHFNTHHDLMHEGRWGNAITINGKVQPEIKVKPGERIRLRLINGASARIFLNQIKGLKPVVIAVDGRPVSKTFDFGNFPLSPGNRVDLDITIPKDAGGKTYVFEDRFTRNVMKLAKITVLAEPAAKTPDFIPPLLTDFIPAESFDNKPISKSWELDAIQGGKFGIGWSMNRKLWPDADTMVTNLDQPIKLQFTNTSTRFHPMHIHGAFFRVLSVNGKTVNEQFTRDTVLINPRDTIVIGLKPDLQGIWMAHCHILSHSESGMMTTIEVE